MVNNRNRFSLLVFAVCIPFLWAAVLFAESGAGEDQVEASASSERGEKRIALTLDDCIRQAYRNNLGLRKSMQSMSAEATRVEEARGKFDPSFFANAHLSAQESPSTSKLDAGFGVTKYQQRTRDFSTGFTGTLLTGGTYTVSLDFNGTDNADSQWLLYNPIVHSEAGVELRQPLLKGGWTAVTMAEETAAVLQTRSEALNAAANLNDTLFEVIQAYWDLVFARQDLGVKEKSLSLAEDLLAINTRKKEEGTFSKIDVVEAQADVAVKKEELITARNAVKGAEDHLKRLIFPVVDPTKWEVLIVPLTDPKETSSKSFDMEVLVREARKHRPDYRAGLIEVNQRELDLQTARNAMLPSLDLVGKYSFSAIGSNYGNSMDDIYRGKYPYYRAGIEFTLPLGNRSARAACRRAAIELERARTNLEDIQAQIVQDVRDAVREVKLQRERVAATRESYRLAKERYEGEKKRLEAGLSISYQVREAERNMSQEEASTRRALLDYQVALARLEKVKGTLLDRFGLKEPRLVEEESLVARR